ncbi:hypothetical protein [Arthrobacter sp. efr-133-TYG-118]|uniref:hypothetical protein n=1 Tax=Arthrobacter sp. efr-133-TYG-118 TaxID=3040279 RepID=UPI0025502A7C|nr:hypothetical protein [Arthrobacter sp. efr-133-TYG-118]
MEIRNRGMLVDELMAVMRGYEAANNTHDIERVLPYIAEDASGIGSAFGRQGANRRGRGSSEA